MPKIDLDHPFSVAWN